MIKVKGKALPKVRVDGPTLERVDGSVVAAGLGAERTEASVSTRQGTVALFALRQALAERLHSTGGRPSLGVSRRQKIPLDDADWELLCRIAELLSDGAVSPTPGQVASELLRQRLHQVSVEMEHTGSDQLRKTLGVDTEKRRATG
jgi:hypothetical protein